MATPDLTPAMQEMLAQMAALRAELDALKQRANHLTQPVQPPQPTVSTTRRSALRKLAGGLLAGLAVGGVAAVIPQPAEAKFVGASNAGAVIIPRGSTSTGSMSANRQYGMVATSDDSIDLSSGFYFANGDRIGVYGISTNDADNSDPNNPIFGGIAVYGIGTQGIFGYSPGATGVNGFGGTTGTGGSSGTTGVLGIGGKYGGVMQTDNASTTVFSQTNTGIGLVVNAGSTASFSNVQNNQNLGLYVEAGTGGSRTAKAAIFKGDVQIVGAYTASGTKSFKMDHPLDPANKYLSHSVVESPDMKNVYDGVVTLDGQGQAIVEMPSYFETLNSDYRYQLTPLGQAAPNLHISEEIKQRKFKIAGGLAGQKVSWQVTGIRQDAYARANPIKVEENKTGEEKGTYLHPELYGQPQKQSVKPGPAVGADLIELINRKFPKK